MVIFRGFFVSLPEGIHLVGGAITILKNMSSSIGRIIPCIVENKACSKPSISCNIIYNYEGNHNSSTIINRSNTGNKENNDNTSDNDKKTNLLQLL